MSLKTFIAESNYINLHKSLCVLESQFVIDNPIQIDIITKMVDDVIHAFNNLLIAKYDIIGRKATVTEHKYYNLHEQLCLLEQMFLKKEEDFIEGLVSKVDNVIVAFNELLL
jgi:hypothetical protein